MSQKPTQPKGTRDFGPVTMAKRNFIFDKIKTVFQKFGFLPLETPAMENLSVLTGKYGEEGDQLVFKVLNSGDYLKKTSVEDFNAGSKPMLSKIAEKGLKYDLTVPFARYVVMNQHDITFPFKRYQIQPVWRADRPQKGRYREFYQCDADVVGTNSLLCEAEIILMINEVFENLGIKEYSIKINHRQLLAGMARLAEGGAESDFYVALDKIDKKGKESVFEELRGKGFSEDGISKIDAIISLTGSFSSKIQALKEIFSSQEAVLESIQNLEEILKLSNSFNEKPKQVELDLNLARGLSYYTGTIFEVKVHHTSIGSVSGGGRYDDLTGVFGLKGVSGVGFSFGVDRLYDVMEELQCFPAQAIESTEVLVVAMEDAAFHYGMQIVSELREAGLKSELYPDLAKLKKVLNYANKKSIPKVILIGSKELEEKGVTIKNMHSGEQNFVAQDQIVSYVTNNNQ